ncbi:STAS domain-containing protein [Cohnella abietis]|uniref:STAS domain-containing protein n=1 Tax=Cohnella abietis TaxID=2507935 RepID=A0A3T1CYY5_9BACL|nr:STAS domain-containing protein [Cohnella abietis]BBI31021.1 hypothetical protein KCTCHS21_04200 [Cohnella abietis]
MCYEIKNIDYNIEVILNGIINVREATAIRQKLFPLLQQGFRSLTFHLGMVTDMDSSGLGLLLASQKMANDCDATIAFNNVPEQIKERLYAVGIDL